MLRLDNMKKEVGETVNALMAQMSEMNPEDLMTEEEINQHLTDAFNKFDEDRSGQLGQWEFQQAWFYLGLKGTEEEVKRAFADVDADNSGMVDLNEFITTIKSARMSELSLNHVLKKMGVHFDESQAAYEAYKKKAQRRRILKRNMEANVATQTQEIIKKLAMMSDTPLPEKNSEDAKLYKTLKDTFDAFDKDGSAEMQFPEYCESWKFLGRSGTEQDMKKSFDAVDIDGSRQIDVNEFMFSLMGEKAQNYG